MSEILPEKMPEIDKKNLYKALHEKIFESIQKVLDKKRESSNKELLINLKKIKKLLIDTITKDEHKETDPKKVKIKTFIDEKLIELGCRLT